MYALIDTKTGTKLASITLDPYDLEVHVDDPDLAAKIEELFSDVSEAPVTRVDPDGEGGEVWDDPTTEDIRRRLEIRSNIIDAVLIED